MISFSAEERRGEEPGNCLNCLNTSQSKVPGHCSSLSTLSLSELQMECSINGSGNDVKIQHYALVLNIYHPIYRGWGGWLTLILLNLVIRSAINEDTYGEGKVTTTSCNPVNQKHPMDV